MKPLFLLRDGNLPSMLKKKFDNHWRPILEKMHDKVQMVVENARKKDKVSKFIESTYNLALKNVCLKYPDMAAKLSGGNAVSTMTKAVKDYNKKRKATAIST